MIKKMAGLLIVGATLLSAQVKDKGFLVGLDLTQASIDSDYTTNGTLSYNDYANNWKKNYAGFKVGYQYYFTRVYFRYNTFDYHDDKRNKFSAKGDAYEFNAEYLPVFYNNSDRSLMLRGIFGAMAGYTKTKIENYDTNLLPVGVSDAAQNKFLYGFQLGLLLESDYDVSVEMGIRYRKGNIMEFVDVNDNAAIFTRKAQEYFLGVNYLF